MAREGRSLLEYHLNFNADRSAVTYAPTLRGGIITSEWKQLPILVILSEAKDLRGWRGEILRFAQDDIRRRI